jgi:3-methyl-2-oxobutanoate hydroxymethyltransferase
MQNKIAPLRAHKNKSEPLVCLTAYTAGMAAILDEICDILLVGDSVGMVLYGMENTLGVDLEMMIRHGQAVMRGAKKTCVVVDMPFGTYEDSPAQAYQNAERIMQETGCDAVKLEGGQNMAATILHLTSQNIPVMGHIGLMPQSVVKDGGYKIKGRTSEQEENLIADAKALEKAGAFSIVIEGTVEDVAQRITASINIPTIGIGASAACDGQILVIDDMLGMTQGHVPRFVKQYADLKNLISTAAKQYAADVRARRFPAPEHTYTASQKTSSKNTS